MAKAELEMKTNSCFSYSPLLDSHAPPAEKLSFFPSEQVGS